MELRARQTQRVCSSMCTRSCGRNSLRRKRNRSQMGGRRRNQHLGVSERPNTGEEGKLSRAEKSRLQFRKSGLTNAHARADSIKKLHSKTGSGHSRKAQFIHRIRAVAGKTIGEFKPTHWAMRGSVLLRPISAKYVEALLRQKILASCLSMKRCFGSVSQQPGQAFIIYLRQA